MEITSEQLRAENEALRQRLTAAEQRNDQYLDFINQMPQGIFIYHLEDLDDDYTLRIIAANPAVKALTGADPNDMIGKTLDECFPGLREQGVPQIYANVARTGETAEFETVYGDDHVIESAFAVRAFPLPGQWMGVSFDNITARKQAEQDLRNLNAELEQRINERTEELRYNQTLLQTVLDTSPAAIYVKDLEGQFLLVNQRTSALLGLTPQEMQGKQDTELFPAEFAAQWRANEQHAIDAGEPISIEETVIQPDGVHTFLSIRTPIYNGTGEIYAIGGIASDITERKQQEEQLQMFKTLVENAPDAISVATLEGVEIYANPVFKRRTGYGEQVIGMRVPELYNESQEIIKEVIERVLEHGYWQGENSYRCGDEQVMPNLASIFLVNDDDGTPHYIASIESDITERKQQEEVLRTFKTLVENALDGIVYATPDGIIRYSNKSYATITGFGDRVVGSAIADYYAPEDVPFVMETLLPAVVSEGSWQGMVRLRRPNGTFWMGQASIIALRNDAGELALITATFRDVTEQLAAEQERAALQQQVIDAQRDALRELSTPLIPITDHVVIMPLIGSIDSGRAQLVMETLLQGVAQHRAELALLDITGVSVVDTQVAQALVSAAQAVKLLGAQVMLTGIQPQIAQTLVHLGVELRGILTRGSLQAGIAYALHYSNKQR